MKKCKKIVCAIVIACILAGVAFVALEFMGVIDLNSARKTEEKSETEQDGNKIADDETEPWHIVFKGYAFSVKPVGLAIIHESGCLNIRSCDDYLIQIDVEDKTMADFWRCIGSGRSTAIFRLWCVRQKTTRRESRRVWSSVHGILF